MPWWNAQTHADRRPLLALRGRIKAGLRAWFEGQGLPRWNAAPWRSRPATRPICMPSPPAASGPMGRPRRFTCTPRRNSPPRNCWRRARPGSSNSPASSAIASAPACMRRNSPCWNGIARAKTSSAVMDDTLALARRAARSRTPSRCGIRDRRLRSLCRGRTAHRRRCLPHPCRDRTSGHAGSPEGRGDRDIFATRAKRAGFSIAADDGWSDIFSKVLAAAIEPRLGLERLTLADRLSRARKRRWPGPSRRIPRLSERFELYACGVELANGFGELTDPAEQRARFDAEMDEKQRVHGERYPLDEDFLAALAQMPPGLRGGAGV